MSLPTPYYEEAGITIYHEVDNLIGPVIDCYYETWAEKRI